MKSLYIYILDKLKDRTIKYKSFFILEIKSKLSVNFAYWSEFLLYSLYCKGFFVTRHYEYMLHKQLRDPYHKFLMNADAPVKMCCQVLRNLQTYLVEEEVKMMKADSECKSYLKCFSFIWWLII